MTWTPPIWVRVVLLIGLAAREIYFSQSAALSHIWVMARHQYGISLLVPQASFRVALRSVGCVFRLRRLRSSEILVSRSGSGKTKQITWHGNEQCHCCSRSLLLLTPTTWFSLVRKRNRSAKSELESERGSPVTLSGCHSLATGNQSEVYSTVKDRLYSLRGAYKRRVLYKQNRKNA